MYAAENRYGYAGFNWDDAGTRTEAWHLIAATIAFTALLLVAAVILSGQAGNIVAQLAASLGFFVAVPGERRQLA